ncbi:MAG: hypothetical protein LBD84_05995 [Campylobacteraceae bacterium]|jgi:hypothetical protein|nr:hypothetical protein [Campylobacteraceae bacterium]
MTYRDNDVYFTNKAGGPSLIGGSYTIKDFCITNGQDPEGRISKKEFPVNSETISFSVR